MNKSSPSADTSNTTTDLESPSTEAIIPQTIPLPPSNQIIEIYFTFLCGVNPLIEKEKLKYFTNNYLFQIDEEKIELEENEWIKSKEEMKSVHCFYLAISAYAKQATEGLDETILKKAEKEFAIMSMDYSTEFYWAASALILLIVYIGEGNLYKLNYYLAIVNFYIENNKDCKEHKFFKPLERYRDQIASRFKNNVQSLGNTLESLSKIFFHSTSMKLEDFLLPGVWEHMKTSPVTPQNFILFKQVLDIIFQTMVKFKQTVTESLVDCHNEIFFQSQRLYTTIITEGYILLFLKQIQEVSFPAMEEIALKITLLTENELFL
ncbi:predicted protein [Naegleria gruberi]|uniref:Predicted protein n=1 Tax=Naegleria gruberi TaxID=5762 RepID=D2W1G2_NAEGR|nr:uncharacterized protein NAEGRDRAFT_75206 [Naegleria gruberi]EFC37041.1 predicted protein [Naegleria gruberi]|eukprot:XP_002669785.1 predicted protein [Naegleria gruberi strain NEG-M]